MGVRFLLEITLVMGRREHRMGQRRKSNGVAGLTKPQST